MDYRCPACKADLGKGKLRRAILVRMDVDCTNCKSTIRLNIHRAEAVIVLLHFGAIVAFGGLAYWLQSQALAFFAFGAAMVGASAMPLLERTWLRHWPRYTSIVQSPIRGADSR